MNPAFDWSTVSDHTLAQLAREYSASQIAQQLGCSRNAVIGRCARRGIRLSRYLVPRVEPIERAAKRRAADRRRYAAKRAALSGLPFTPEWQGIVEAVNEQRAPITKPQAAGITITELRARSCRYPLWSKEAQPADKLYCGAETEEGAVYCAHCSRLCYSPRRTEALDRKLGFFKLARAA